METIKKSIETKNLSLEEKKAIVRRYCEGGVSEWKEVCAPDMKVNAPPIPTINGLEELVKYTNAGWGQHMKEPHNKAFKVDEMIAEGEAIAVRWSAHGTPKNDWTVPGIATFKADKPISFIGLSIIRLRNDKIIEEYTIHGPFQQESEKK